MHRLQKSARTSIKEGVGGYWNITSRPSYLSLAAHPAESENIYPSADLPNYLNLRDFNLFIAKSQVQNFLRTLVSTMASELPHPTISAGDHKAYMEYALERARLSPPAITKFCVGAVLVDADENAILSTGYSLELPRDSLGDPGSTHAEQCCFIKVAQKHNLPEERIGEVLPKNTVLYTTMEPCNKRLSGNRTCVERILRLNGAIKVVYVGIREPEVFVGENVGMQKLKDAGVIVEVVEGIQDRILQVSTAGHEVEKS